uniref:Uncharacterized protein n=1 Tax=Physcomitrium patens TaxID=3218 RepID=A0A2K1IBC1_PHYPA|nr:hypothetical protein PHYPA_030057 [Physcomitrium patens]
MTPVDEKLKLKVDMEEEEIQHPRIIHYDTIGNISIATNPRISPRTSHIVAHYHFTKTKIKARKLNLQYVPTMERVANTFTKPLGRSLFNKFQERLNLSKMHRLLDEFHILMHSIYKLSSHHQKLQWCWKLMNLGDEPKLKSQQQIQMNEQKNLLPLHLDQEPQPE